MTGKVSEEAFVQLKTDDVIHAAQSLIAVSSILVAVADQYAHTGQLSIGAIRHAGNVVDQVIERLGLAELEAQQAILPF